MHKGFPPFRAGSWVTLFYVGMAPDIQDTLCAEWLLKSVNHRPVQPRKSIASQWEYSSSLENICKIPSMTVGR